MTLLEIIARYEGRPIKTVRRTALTPKGRATVAARQLGRLLADVPEGTDRLDILGAAMSEAMRILNERAQKTA